MKTVYKLFSTYFYKLYMIAYENNLTLFLLVKEIANTQALI